MRGQPGRKFPRGLALERAGETAGGAVDWAGLFLEGLRRVRLPLPGLSAVLPVSAASRSPTRPPGGALARQGAAPGDRPARDRPHDQGRVVADLTPAPT